MTNRILIVEDEAILAFDLANQLRDASFDVLGPAPTVARALALLKHSDCAAAVIDVHLASELSTPVARELLARGIPFVVVSGYFSEQLPDDFANAAILSKPARTEDVIESLKKCIGLANVTVPK